MPGRQDAGQHHMYVGAAAVAIEQERDTLRSRLSDALDEIGEWQAASGLVGVAACGAETDPSGVTPAHLAAYLEGLRRERDEAVALLRRVHESSQEAIERLPQLADTIARPVRIRGGGLYRDVAAYLARIDADGASEG